MFSVKINQKLYTQSSNFTLSWVCGLMKLKLHLHLDPVILFWKKCTSHTCDGQKGHKTSPNHFISSSIQGSEHKRKMDQLLFTAWFVHLLVSCHVKLKTSIGKWKPASNTAPSPTASESVGSLCPIQFERVNCLSSVQAVTLKPNISTWAVGRIHFLTLVTLPPCVTKRVKA